MTTCKPRNRLLALLLAVTLALGMLSAISYAADEGESSPDISPAADSADPTPGMSSPDNIAAAARAKTSAVTGEEDIIDTSTWDVEFLDALKRDYSDLFDGENLLKSQVESVTSLDLERESIQSLAGIEYFTALTRLNCYMNSLTDLDLSKNTALTILQCGYNGLTSLDLSNNTALTVLYCSGNSLTDLDLSKNTALAELYCRVNDLTDLDLLHNTELTLLDCCSNSLMELDLSHNTKLTRLECGINNLTELDLSNNTKLTKLECQGNSLTELDLSNNTALTELDCEGNSLTDLDLSNDTALTWLNCGKNSLTELDLSHNLALTDLLCPFNNLINLNLSNCKALTILYCNGNSLTELDLSHNSALTWIYCDKNSLTDLDLSNKKELTMLDCRENSLTNLNLSNCKALTTLCCYENNLTDLDLSDNTALTDLECFENSLTDLDLSNNLALTDILCAQNPIQHLILPTGEELTIPIQPSNGGSIMLWPDYRTHDFVYSKKVNYFATPAKGYTFDGWTGDVDSTEPEISFDLSGNMTVTANFSKIAEQPNTYTVTFKDWDGVTLKTETVNSGDAATAPEAPTRIGYTFTGWDKSFDAVAEDLIVTAQYEQKTASEILEDAKELDPSSPSDTEEIRELEDVYKDLTKVSVRVIADPNTHGNFKNNVDAIQVVGAAFNAELNDTVMLHFSKPANKVTIDGTRYKTNSAVQLDISLLKNGTPMRDLAVPITITVPIPSGVAERNFWILHYHTDGTLERIQPAVNGDGTCTFTVDSFSVFAFVNGVDPSDNVDNNTSNDNVSNSTNDDTVWNDSNDSNSPSSSSSVFTVPSPNAPATPKGTLSTRQAASRTRAAVENAKKSGANQAVVRLKNMKSLMPQAAQTIVKEAGGFPVKVQADSTLNNGKINVRLSFDPARITNTVQLAAFIDSAKTRSVRALFTGYFKNYVQVVRFEQKGDFGIPVNMAVKLDAKLVGKTLYFYHYNQTDNVYTQIVDPQYWVDVNGYVHFTTRFADSIVISDGPLTKK